MTTLLVLTAGKTDVQIVINGQRHELKSDKCGVMHDEIERRGYRIVDVPVGKKGPPQDKLPEGELTLCTPKLDAVLAYCEDNSPPAAALIFDTRRTLESDPRYAGAVLEYRLRERGVQAARRHSLLTGTDRLESADDPRDAVVRRAVIQGVGKVLAMVFDDIKSDNVVAATTGGMPAANAVIEELVRLHGVGRASVQVVEIPDGAFTAQADRAVPENFHPAAGLRARWQALSLIVHGNLLGARGAVSHLESEPGQEWTQVVRWLANFAASLPNDACEIEVLKPPRMAVPAALRVELALRAEDIPRAVHGTVAFFEAALWDHLNERLERHPEKRRLFRIKDGNPPNSDKLLRCNDCADDNRKRPFELKETENGVDWFWIYDDEACAGRLAKYYLKSTPLQKLGQAVSQVRELRNDVAHNEPTNELMSSARQRMVDAQLWSQDNSFLAQPLVQDVLRELGEQHPDRICEELMMEVRTRLLKPVKSNV